jgi:hypothetical protein
MIKQFSNQTKKQAKAYNYKLAKKQANKRTSTSKPINTKQGTKANK